MEINVDTPVFFQQDSIFSMDYLSLPNILLTVPAGVWWMIFGLSLLVNIIFTIILIYHWNKYRLHSPKTFSIQIIYLVGIVTLVFFSGAMLVTYII